ncbi:hypothetical protein ATN84_07300 [Paramesorhizobium deserti]|uniref:Uncharacterized protein n=1 Tax=Paramesorhizobium deserti TaxID=1494590 RepID=A0A135HVJ9_9HYPH|nr:hypothetical protein ATN84_07300 [Paramesorhizobium deserti]
MVVELPSAPRAKELLSNVGSAIWFRLRKLMAARMLKPLPAGAPVGIFNRQRDLQRADFSG